MARRGVARPGEARIFIMDKLLKLLRDLIERKFYGIIEVKIEAGNVVHIKLIENIKP